MFFNLQNFQIFKIWTPLQWEVGVEIEVEVEKEVVL